jgi:hypothetical protein
MRRFFCLTLLGFASVSVPCHAAEKLDPKGVEFFESKIRPVLAKYCYECHSAKSSKVKGNLLLDTRAGIRAGGDTGPAVVPGKISESLIISSLKHEDFKMPPKERLPDSIVHDFETWIAMGAPDPRDGGSAKAYHTLTLEESKNFWSFKQPVKHSPPAVKNAAWAKTEIDKFLLAKMEEKNLHPAPDAKPAALLRRLHFDLVGLPPSAEEVDAFENSYAANPRQAIEKVVDALLASRHFGERWGRYWLDIARFAETNGNADNVPLPEAYRYRNYVIAAYNADKPYDQFIREQIAGDLLPAKNNAHRDELLTATGVFALTSKPRAQNNPDYKYDLLADQIDVATRAVLGLSVMCARCHDHKFDPISTKEYYSLAGIFDSSLMLWGTNGGAANGVKGARINGFHKLSDGGNAMGLREGTPNDIAVCIRGESKDLGEIVPRGYLKAVSVSDAPEINRQQSGRLELAQYMSSRYNPFTARVAVNRIWQHLFGQGIVRTPDNFGNLGEKPTHPELLDYLALRFVDLGWSTKKMIREIVLTRAYQMSSAHDDANYKLDPDGLYVWRMPTRRLDAEAIRDAVMFVSGALNLEPMQGTMIGTLQGGKKNITNGAAESNHRSVYQAILRGRPMPEVLSLFDLASPNLIVAQREVTTVPAQALFLMNSNFIRNHSRQFADRLLAAKGVSDAQRVDLAYKMAFGRNATQEERDRTLGYLNEFAKDSMPAAAWQTFCQTLYAAAEFRYIE